MKKQKPKGTPFNLGPLVEIVGPKGDIIKGHLVLPAPMAKVAVPRQFLFEAVQVLRRAENSMQAVGGAIRGMRVSRDGLDGTEFGRAMLDLGELREDVEEHSMRTGVEAIT